MSKSLDAISRDIRACRICRDEPHKQRLAHEPRPVFRVSATATIGIFSQAPGARVHASGVPFTDPSGIRLRQWMGVTDEEFYDGSRVAVVPMGFCFPGYDAKGADRPPRSECAPLWRERLLAELPALKLILLVGGYSQRWHLADKYGENLSVTVANWRAITRSEKRHEGFRFWPLPHPSWRNNAWLRKNPWFIDELLPELRADVRAALKRRRAVLAAG